MQANSQQGSAAPYATARIEPTLIRLDNPHDPLGARGFNPGAQGRCGFAQHCPCTAPRTNCTDQPLTPAWYQIGAKLIATAGVLLITAAKGEKAK